MTVPLPADVPAASTADAGGLGRNPALGPEAASVPQVPALPPGADAGRVATEGSATEGNATEGNATEGNATGNSPTGGALVRNGVVIDDTFAEAFPMKATRLVITAHDLTWARHAAVSATGFATSVIACGCEAGIERELAPDETPDGRPGYSILIFSMSGKELAKQVERRVGQCVLTCPTTAVFAGIAEGEAIALGKNLRFFGDGWQMSKVIGGLRYWRVPVMDGEFVIQETTAVTKAVGGGNLLMLATDTGAALAAAVAAVQAMQRLPNVVMPFPGGVVRSGSKVGSKYPALIASTNDAFCPGLYGLAAGSELAPELRCVLEIVIDGLTEADVAAAMRAGMQACIDIGAAGGLRRLSAGNYGGKLGPYHFHLHKLLAAEPGAR